MKRQVKIKTAFKRAHEILSRGLITETEIRTLRKNIGYCGGLTASESNDLLSLFEDVKLDLTKEQQRKGIQWLKNTHFKLNGSQRKSSKLSAQHLQVIRTFSHFTFEGLRSEWNSESQRFVCVSPIYRTYSKLGLYFDYVVNPSFFGSNVDYLDVQGEIKLKRVGAK